MQAKRSLEAHEMDKVESALDRAAELTRLFTEASLLVDGPWPKVLLLWSKSTLKFPQIAAAGLR